MRGYGLSKKKARYTARAARIQRDMDYGKELLNEVESKFEDGEISEDTVRTALAKVVSKPLNLEEKLSHWKKVRNPAKVVKKPFPLSYKFKKLKLQMQNLKKQIDYMKERKKDELQVYHAERKRIKSKMARKARELNTEIEELRKEKKSEISSIKAEYNRKIREEEDDIIADFVDLVRDHTKLSPADIVIRYSIVVDTIVRTDFDVPDQIDKLVNRIIEKGRELPPARRTDQKKTLSKVIKQINEYDPSIIPRWRREIGRILEKMNNEIKETKREYDTKINDKMREAKEVNPMLQARLNEKDKEWKETSTWYEKRINTLQGNLALLRLKVNSIKDTLKARGKPIPKVKGVAS